MTENDRLDLLTDYLDQMEESACMLVALAKGKQSTAETIVYVDADGNDATADVYDFRYHTWKSSDTLDKLADDYMGNADYATLIAYYNKISAENELESGVKIKIPVLSENSGSENNAIYALPENWNNYGSDILIDDDGDIAVSGNDLKPVSGTDNLAQAIAMRLTTTSTKRIRLVSYGIRSNIGDPIAIESYLTSTIEQTIMADPRVSSVDEITFLGNGDSLYLEVSWTDINGNKGDYKGEI